MQVRLIAGAFIGGALYFDPVGGYIQTGIIEKTLEGGLGGLIGGDVAQMVAVGSGFQVFSIYGKGYAACGALGGLVSGIMGLSPMMSALVGVASTLLDGIIIPWEGKIF